MEINFTNVTNNALYHPGQRQEAADSDKEILFICDLYARILKHSNKELSERSLYWIGSRIIPGDFPAAGDGYCEGLTCLANSGEHSQNKGRFCPFGVENEGAHVWFYKANNGAYCIAVFSGQQDEVNYYLIQEARPELSADNTVIKNFCETLQKLVEQTKPGRSAWSKGVHYYAEYLCETLDEILEDHITTPQTVEELEKLLLNGAYNWNHYSTVGSGLVYNESIARTLLTPSEIKRQEKKYFGENMIPHESRALWQAFNWIIKPCFVEYQNSLNK